MTKKKILKQKSFNGIVPLDEQTWLLQPVAVTTMRYDYNVTQNRALVSIMEQMQASLKRIVSEKITADQLSLFTEHDFDTHEVSENEIMLKIQLKDLSSDPRRYKEVKDTLKELVNIQIEIPVKDQNGKSYTRISGLCEAYIEDKSYVDHVHLKLKKDIALRLLDTQFGVHKYLKSVVFSTKNKYMQRLYMYISSWKKAGKTPAIKVADLRRMLRIEEKHSRWNMFYKRVIVSAMDELKEKAISGETDCYFTVEPVYKNGKSRGEPEALIFTIIQSEAGEAASDVMGHKSRQITIEHFLKDFLQQSPANVRTLSAQITDDNIEAFHSFITDLSAKVTDKQDTIKDLRAWAYTCCIRWFEENSKEAAQLDTKRIELSTPIAPNSEHLNTAEPIAPISEQIIHSEEDLKQWSRFLMTIRGEVSETEYNTWFKEPLILHSITDKGLTINAPIFVVEVIESKFLNQVAKAITEVFGKEKGLYYNFPK